MALQWDFSCKAGTITELENGQEVTSNFYEGNALMIVTNEWREDGKDLYTMSWFFVGDEHAKNCLGLSKGHDNMFGADRFTRMTIYRKHCRNWEKLVKLFTKAFPHIAIDIREAE